MIRALIIDDEMLAREGVRVLLRQATDVEIVGEASDGPTAVKAIKKFSPDLLFLDVQMPGFDGFEILERVSSDYLPAVIFVTAHDAYAVRAFESRALDYILKPINGKRFQETLQRVRLKLAMEEALDKAHKNVADLLRSREHLRAEMADGVAPTKTSSMQRFAVKDRDRFLLLKSGEIDWIESAANYVQLHARGRSFLLRMTMNELEGELDSSLFVRIHRSTIVNIERIVEIKPTWHGDFEVILQDATSLRLSRAHRHRLLPG